MVNTERDKQKEIIKQSEEIRCKRQFAAFRED